MTPTPLRAVRVNDALWTAVKKKALKEGKTITEVITAALEAYIRKH